MKKQSVEFRLRVARTVLMTLAGVFFIALPFTPLTSGGSAARFATPLIGALIIGAEIWFWRQWVQRNRRV